MLELKKYDQAVADEQRSLALDPENAVAYEAIGDVYALTGKPSDAIAAYEHVLKIDPSNLNARAKRDRLRANGSAVSFAFGFGGAVQLADAFHMHIWTGNAKPEAHRPPANEVAAEGIPASGHPTTDPHQGAGAAGEHGVRPAGHDPASEHLHKSPVPSPAPHAPASGA